MENKPRLWFFGGGAFAADCLAHMSERIAFERIVTGHPTRAGRGLRERVSHVEEAALKLGLSVERTGPLAENGTLAGAMADSPPDAAFVIDFGQILRAPFLNGPRHGCLNIHPSLLPRWRGAAPVQRALMNGDAVTGVTVFRLVGELDAGPVLARREIPVSLTEDASDLLKILALAGSQIAEQSVQSLIEGSCQFSEQNSESATYAAKVAKAETEVFWSQSSLQVHNTVRALVSSTGAFGMTLGKRLKLWKTIPVDFQGEPGRVVAFTDGCPVIACADGAVCLLEVQSEGRQKTSGAQWARGARLNVGMKLM